MLNLKDPVWNLQEVSNWTVWTWCRLNQGHDWVSTGPSILHNRHFTQWFIVTFCSLHSGVLCSVVSSACVKNFIDSLFTDTNRDCWLFSICGLLSWEEAGAARLCTHLSDCLYETTSEWQPANCWRSISFNLKPNKDTQRLMIVLSKIKTRANHFLQFIWDRDLQAHYNKQLLDNYQLVRRI